MIDTKAKEIGENSFLKLIDIVPDAIVIIDKEGNIKYVNSQTEEMFGYNKDELIGQKIEILVPERHKKKHVGHRDKYAHSPIRRSMGSGLDLCGKRKDGSEIPLDIMLSPFETTEGRLVISVIRDVSLQKEVENQAKRKASQLEDVVSSMTHDLKTPLLATKTSCSHMLEGYFGNLTEEQKQVIELLQQSSENSLTLVKNLLSVFRYESRFYKLLLEQVDISILLNKAVDSVKSLASENKIILKIVPCKFELKCDLFELERVLVNLLSNAIKHSPTGEKVEIKAIKDVDGNITITIEDKGLGISKEDLPNLFNRFWYSRRSNLNAHSTGLGLYLSKQIVEAHGGKIWVKSELGKGTEVSFSMPSLMDI